MSSVISADTCIQIILHEWPRTLETGSSDKVSAETLTQRLSSTESHSLKCLTIMIFRDLQLVADSAKRHNPYLYLDIFNCSTFF